MKKVLTIAGSDCSGGAGIQADIKTISANGVYAMSVITALTAQNTMGVSAILNVDAEFLGKQIDAIFNDIYPDAVKIGMVSSVELIETIAERLVFYNARNIVVDPVMVATSGSRLIDDEAISVLLNKLLPISTLVTPNIFEAEILSGISIKTKADMIHSSEIINKRYGCTVLCKGGHSINDANDLLFNGNDMKWFKGKRINNPNTHGTGCTLSSAIASNLAKGHDIFTAVKIAKEYISRALSEMLDIGNGSGPLKHNFNLTGRFSK